MIKGTKLFKVTISGEGVDPRTFNQYKEEEYKDFDFSTGSVEDYQTKAKANYRWMLMSMKLNKGLETLSNIKTTGDDPKTVPSEVEFVLTYTQPDALYVKEDENVFEGKNAIEKIIADTLNQEYEVILTWFDPKQNSSANDKIYVSTLPNGEATSQMTVEPVQPSVTVEEVTEYTQFEE